MRRKRFLIGGLIVFLAAGYLGYTAFQRATIFYYTVSELLEQAGSIYGQNVRVNGEVTPDSVEQEAAGRILRFTIIDGEESLPVVYHGIVPDTFKAGSDVTIEGYLDLAGIFQAHTLMPKCPSRYAPSN